MKKVVRRIPKEWGMVEIYEDGSRGFKGKDHGAGSDPEPAGEDVVSPGEIRQMNQDADPLMQKYIENLKGGIDDLGSDLPPMKVLRPTGGDDPDGEQSLQQLIEDMKKKKDE